MNYSSRIGSALQAAYVVLLAAALFEWLYVPEISGYFIIPGIAIGVGGLAIIHIADVKGTDTDDVGVPGYSALLTASATLRGRMRWENWQFWRLGVFSSSIGISPLYKVLAIVLFAFVGATLLAGMHFPVETVAFATIAYVNSVVLMPLDSGHGKKGPLRLSVWALLPETGSRSQFAKQYMRSEFVTMALLTFPAWLLVIIALLSEEAANGSNSRGLFLLPMLYGAVSGVVWLGVAHKWLAELIFTMALILLFGGVCFLLYVDFTNWPSAAAVFGYLVCTVVFTLMTGFGYAQAYRSILARDWV